MRDRPAAHDSPLDSPTLFNQSLEMFGGATQPYLLSLNISIKCAAKGQVIPYPAQPGYINCLIQGQHKRRNILEIDTFNLPCRYPSVSSDQAGRGINSDGRFRLS